MNPIPEFTETELWTVRTALSKRYGKSIELRLADSRNLKAARADTLIR